jgi:hypothetical protein
MGAVLNNSGLWMLGSKVLHTMSEEIGSPLTRTELDIETGKVLYEWSSLDHVDPSGEY